MLALSILFFSVIRALPWEAAWTSYAGQDAYNAILGGMSSFGIVPPV
jgi:hypothetical protein